MKRKMVWILLSCLIGCTGCYKEQSIVDGLEDSLTHADIPDWRAESHEKLDEPAYDRVFDQDAVQVIEITIDANYWEAMVEDLEDNLSAAGMGGPGGPGGPGGRSDFDPIWVPSTVHYSGSDWYKVGIRFKGNSSLQSTYRSGIKKFSFKLDFDQFEDTYPVINNQRFYGFKQLNLKNNFEDASMIREKVASDLFRDFGLASPEASFYSVYVDYGEGFQYFGLYTMVEEVDDTVLDTQFGSESGNLYKPDGDAASFAYGTYTDSEMEKKNNENEEDYSDVKALYDILHSDLRSSDPDQWMADLELVLDVDVFLKWLAANTVMQNWDTYGTMTHNYYLYHDPATDLLNWIPWDNNEALQDGKQGGTLNLALEEVGQSWPLIRFLMDQPDYESIYRAHVQAFAEQVFTTSRMTSLYSSFETLLESYVEAEESGFTFLRYPGAFSQAFNELRQHVIDREQAVLTYISK